MAQNKRQMAEKKGRRAELWASLYLRLKGYRILDKRFRTKVGEIDLIAKQGQTLVFIEVKARKSVDDALLSIAYKQRRRIEAASQAWMKRYQPSFQSLRFDIIAIVPRALPTHIRSAWRANE